MLPLSAVLSGTPNRLATVMPAIMIDTAPVLCPSSARLTAAMEATPKYAPWGRPAMKRDTSMVW